MGIRTRQRQHMCKKVGCMQLAPRVRQNHSPAASEAVGVVFQWRSPEVTAAAVSWSVCISSRLMSRVSSLPCSNTILKAVKENRHRVT